MNSKYKQIQMAIMGVAGASGLSIAYGLFKSLKMMNDYNLSAELLSSSFITIGNVIPLVGAILLLKEFKKDHFVSWLLATLLFFYSLMNLFTLPFAILGLLATLDESIREQHIKKWFAEDLNEPNSDTQKTEVK